MQFLIGCDPEVFVKKDGFFKSAFNLIPGTKKEPHKVRRGAVQVDGMALEFNIDPAASEDEFVINVNEVFHQLALMVPDYEIATVPVAYFGEEYLKQQPKEALELGCDPDYNAWDGHPNKRPDAARPIRTASGHIHIGWCEKEEGMEHVQNAQQAARQMDYFLGLPSLFWDDDQERRSMYGRAGCHRVKPYGVEYRTLSNAWLNKEYLMRLVYRNAQEGMERLLNEGPINSHGDIQNVINSNDKKEAERIMKIHGINGV
jgi:Phage phiEco32-like COOH.NH2 ligase-type 2